MEKKEKKKKQQQNARRKLKRKIAWIHVSFQRYVRIMLLRNNKFNYGWFWAYTRVSKYQSNDPCVVYLMQYQHINTFIQKYKKEIILFFSLLT